LAEVFQVAFGVGKRLLENIWAASQ